MTKEDRVNLERKDRLVWKAEWVYLDHPVPQAEKVNLSGNMMMSTTDFYKYFLYFM